MKEQVALIVQDLSTYWLQAYACETKSGKETLTCLQTFFGDTVPRHMCTDGSGEFKSAIETLGCLHDTSRPYTPQTNAKAERAVRTVKEGTSALVIQSGLPEEFWPWAMTCFCFLRNVSDCVTNDNILKTPWEWRFGGRWGTGVGKSPVPNSSDVPSMEFRHPLEHGNGEISSAKFLGLTKHIAPNYCHIPYPIFCIVPNPFPILKSYFLFQVFIFVNQFGTVQKIGYGNWQ